MAPCRHYFCFIIDIFVHNSGDLKNKRICPDESYGLFLTCEKKNRISYIYTHKLL